MGRLATELTGSKKERFISFIKNIFKKLKNAVSGLDKLEKKFLSLYRTAGQNKNTDNNGVKQMSIEKDNEGERIVVINTDQGLFVGKNNIEASKIARQYMNEYFKNTSLPLSEYSVVYVNKTGINKYSYSGKSIDDKMHIAKMKASAELDNLLDIADYQGHSDDTKNHKFAEFGFDYYKTKFIVDGQVFEGILDIAVNENGAHFYGMTNIKRVTANIGKYSNLLLGYKSEYNVRSNSNTNISQKDNGVNSSVSENSKNDTDIPQMNTGKDTDNEIIDRYTENQYNNFGWVRANNVLTSAEYQHFNNSFSDNKNLDFKFTKNPTTKEIIIPTGDNANLLNVLVYTKGTFKNPIITKVVRIDGSSETVSVLRNEVFAYEREGYKEPIEIIENDYGQKLFSTLKRDNFRNLSELKQQRKGNVSKEDYSNSRTGENRTRSAETNSADSKAGLNKSAFSVFKI